MQSRSSNHEITGVLSHISQVFENSDGTRVVIADVVILGKTVVVKGQAAEDELVINHTYRLYGRYKTHPKYGDQFMFSQVVPDTPSGRHAVTSYLKTLNGVGEFTAVEMWNRYGENAVQMLREHPEDVAAAMPGKCRFTLEKAEQASVFLRRWHRIEKAKLDLMGLLTGRRVPKTTVDKILKDYGSAAAQALRLNPYLLQRYRGCSFLTADKLYLDLNKSPFRLKRQALCCAYSVSKKSTGDTWFPLATAREYLRESIAGAEQRFEKALELSLRGKILEQRVDPMGVAWVADIRKSSSERALAGFVTRSTRDTEDGFPVLWPAADDLDDLTEHQRSAVAMATRSHIGILAGSPGTGKTFSVARLVAKIIDRYGSHAIAICAPTGKAAVRATESMQKAGVDMSATTIHSLLGVMSADDGGFGFQHNEDDPLRQMFVIVDESSMLDTSLMRSLLSARRPGTHILFVGDTNQLSPVGHGAPLRDLIQAGLPTGVLTKIERNSGQIVRACAEMRDHKRFVPSPKPDVEQGENLIHVEWQTAGEQTQFMLAMLQKIQESGKHDVIWDVQIVCAVNKKSPLSRRELNKIVQAELNPGDDGSPVSTSTRTVFRVRDKIICLKNSRYSAVAHCEHADEEGKVYVANGEQAEVLESHPNKIIARLWSPDRTILIPRGDNDNDEKPDTGAADNDESEKESTGTGCSWELGYVVSVHKSQGSDWPIVIVMLDEHNSASMVQSRNWLYTAVSRAKKVCYTVGKRSVADSICHRDGLRRKTFLTELIREGMAEFEQAEATEDEYQRFVSEQNLMAEILEGVC